MNAVGGVFLFVVLATTHRPEESLGDAEGRGHDRSLRSHVGDARNGLDFPVKKLAWRRFSSDCFFFRFWPF